MGWGVVASAPPSVWAVRIPFALTHAPAAPPAAGHPPPPRFTSHCDSRTYFGKVLAVSASNGSLVASLQTVPQNAGGAYGAGVWGNGGVVQAAPALGSPPLLFSAAGNTFGSPSGAETGYLGERVFSMDAALNVVAQFSGDSPSGDNDVGSTPAVFAPSPASGCPHVLVAAAQKGGALHVARADTMQRLATHQVACSCAGTFQGTPAYDSALNTLFVTAATDGGGAGGYAHSLQAHQVMPDCSLKLRWQTADGTSGAPTNVRLGPRFPRSFDSMILTSLSPAHSRTPAPRRPPSFPSATRRWPTAWSTGTTTACRA